MAGLLVFGLLGLLCAITTPVSADGAGDHRLRVVAERLDIVLSLDGADPVAWRACHPSCAEVGGGSGRSIELAGPGGETPVRVVLRGPGAPVDLQRLRFRADLTEDARVRVVTCQADLPVAGVRIMKSFEVAKEGYEVVMSVRLLGPNAAAFAADRHLELELDAGGMSPAPAAGFAAMLERVGRVVVVSGVVHPLSDEGRTREPLPAGDWVGLRSRYWTLLARADGASRVEPRAGSGVTLISADGREGWRYTFYSGPLESRLLTRADPQLEGLLFSGLWAPLRALSFALLYLFRGLTAVVGHPGIGVIALAVSVKILLLPLTAFAERLQEQVNATQARLQPGIAAIKAAHRGEERARRTLALYRAEGVHPLYTLKSLLGVLIQLPVFVAVFDMLAEVFDLYRVPLLWIQDLSRPDELLRLPLCVPFFGCHVNLLPLLMSGVSLMALWRHHSPALTPALVRRQRGSLMGMTLLFFVLFYTFPASMVLYWTSTNAVQLVRQELGRRLPRRGP